MTIAKLKRNWNLTGQQKIQKGNARTKDWTSKHAILLWGFSIIP